MKHVRSNDGTSIAFDRSGEGPAIIFVGGATADRAAGVSLAEHMASHFTVFTYDRRTVPTLVIDGGESPAYMHHGTQALADVLPHARRRTLEGQDHGAAPEVLAPVLVEFFIVQQA